MERIYRTGSPYGGTSCGKITLSLAESLCDACSDVGIWGCSSEGLPEAICKQVFG